jgi:predicted outer membrane repeat protein
VSKLRSRFDQLIGEHNIALRQTSPRTIRIFAAANLVGIGLVAGLLLALEGVAPQQSARAAGDIVYVDIEATGANNGTSWTDAFTNLQEALDSVSYGDEIWVAEGVYTPTDTAGRNASFHLKSGVAMYGGFDPTDGDDTFRERNWEDNVTVLSGDLDGNDATDANGVVTDTDGIVGDNAYRVVHGGGVTQTAVLNGFTITAGEANLGPGSDDRGAGMYIHNGNPTLTNITFSGNMALLYGGGMYNGGGSSPMVANVTFIRNAANSGGGMYNWDSSPTISNVVFSDNVVTNTGGGLQNYGSSSPALISVTFHSNMAGNYGGGMCENNNTGSVLVNVVFAGNQARAGGGIWNWAGSPTLVNVILSGNAATDGDGGGMANNSGSATLTNVTFSGNTAGNGGGMSSSGGGDLVLANCILWDNTPDQVYTWSPTNVTITHSVVDGGCPAGDSCSSLLDADPDFVRDPDPGPDMTWGTEDDDYGDLRLQPSSPAIDAADNTAVPTDTLDLDSDGNTTEQIPLDLGGNPRFLDMPFKADTGNGVAPIVDMGAFESVPRDPLTRYVAVTGTDSGDCSNPAAACRTPQYAVEQAEPGDEVRIAAGTYTVTDTIRISQSLVLTGGYSTADWDSPDPIANPTRLSGAGIYRVIHITGTGTVAVSHVTIADGYVDSEPGAGIWNAGASLTVRGVTFTSNQLANPAEGDVSGAGIANIDGGGLHLVDCRFEDNSSGGHGGALYNGFGASTFVSGTVFAGNSALGGGGGAIDSRGPLVLVSSTVTGNVASSAGGIQSSGSLSITATLLEGNQALEGSGGAILNMWEMYPVRVTGSTFRNNRAFRSGGAIGSMGSFGFDEEGIYIDDSTLEGNQTVLGDGGAIQAYTHITIHNSCLVNNSVVSLFSPSAPANATDNWWGAADGPSVAGPGHGDSISGTVSFTPFLATSIRGCPDTTPPSPLGATTPLTPSGVITDYKPVFTWQVVANSTRYRLEVMGPPGEMLSGSYEALYYCSTAMTCTIRPNLPFLSGVYTWHVQTSNALGQGPWSEVATFTVAPPPSRTWYASWSGDDDYDCQSPTTACRTIQAAIDKAIQGDTVIVDQGSYHENLIVDKDLTILGSQSGATIIDGGGAGSVIEVKPVSATLRDVVLQNGNAQSGGGINSDYGAHLTVIDAAIQNNTAASYGGGIYSGGSLSLENVTVHGNQAGSLGGGLVLYGSTEITASVVSSNTAGQSGGVHAEFGDVRIVDTLIIENTATSGEAGGLYHYWSGHSHLVGCTIARNSPNGITLAGSSAGMTVTNSSIQHNDGIGIKAFWGATLTVQDSNVSYSEGYGVEGNNDTVVEIDRTTIAHNGGDGFLLYGSAHVSNSTIHANEWAIHNGGVLTITNSTVSSSMWSGLSNSSQGLATVINCTIVDNPHYGIYNFGTVRVQNTLLYQPSNCWAQAPITSLGHNLDAGSPDCYFSGPGDMTASDPGLTGLGDHGGPTWTYALLEGSPAIDAADHAAAPAADQRGVSRSDGDQDGSVVADIGAYEYVPQTTVYLPLVIRQ